MYIHKMMNKLDNIIKNKYLALVLILNNVHTIYTKLNPNTTMQNISADIVELIIKIIMIAVLIGLLTRYEQLKELLFVSRFSNQYNSYHNIQDTLYTTGTDAKKIHKGLIEHEKNSVRKALQKRYPKKSMKDIDRIINEYYL